MFARAQQQRLSWLLGYMVAAFGHALALCEDGWACMSADDWLSMCRLNLAASVWASAVGLQQPRALTGRCKVRPDLLLCECKQVKP